MPNFPKKQALIYPQSWVNDKIRKLQEHFLIIAYDDYTSSINELTMTGKSFLMHKQNIQTLLIEQWKALNHFPGVSI